MRKHLSGNILRQVKEAAAVLKKGGIVAYPTDTVYGLGADICNAKAVLKVFKAKGRPPDMPLPVLISDVSQLDGLAAEVPLPAKLLIEEFWPGGLTIVFKRAPSFHSPLLAGGDKVAVRLPAHSLTVRIIEELGHPITGTSANHHEKPVSLDSKEVRAQMGSRVDYILDGGRCPGGVESTIVDITMDPVAVLREGAIPQVQVLSILTQG